MAEEKRVRSVFEILNSVDVSDQKKDKATGNGKKLSYLSWAWAWTETKKRFPDVNYKVYENDMGFPYHTDGRTAWVKCGVTIRDVEQIEYLAVMDHRNQSIPLDKLTSVDVIRTIQRCVTKAIGRHGLGLYIYAGEDLPEDIDEQKQTGSGSSKSKKQAASVPQAPQGTPCSVCGNVITDYVYTDPQTGATKTYKADTIVKRAMEKYNAPICYDCMAKKVKGEHA